MIRSSRPRLRLTSPSPTGRGRTARLIVAFLVPLVAVSSCSSLESIPPAEKAASAPVTLLEAPTQPPSPVCDRQMPGPGSPPAGAVVVQSTVDNDLAAKTNANPAGTTFWLEPGRHTLGSSEYGQVIPKDGDTYLGAPGAVLDGRGVNRFAFTQRAGNVTIRYLTVKSFVAPQDQGVVNHDSADGWIIEYNTIEQNKGAGLMAGARQQVRYNCLRENGQYGMNAYQAGGGITGLIVEKNEVVGNNTDDWENRIAGCGCTGGIKFWAVNGADIRSNWIHDNRGAGLWADTNDNDFLIEGNLIEKNDAEAIFYEISYNLTLRANTIRENTLVKGRRFAARQDTFPVGTVYLSESGGEPRIPARSDKIEISDNVFVNNWSGITAWENSDRFCNSPSNTSTRYCTLLLPTTAECTPPGIVTAPLYDSCRWKTQRVDVHDNRFIIDQSPLGCSSGSIGRMALLSNYGTYPAWSPYKAEVVDQAITFRQDNVWRNNLYAGPWKFTAYDASRVLSSAQWQADPYREDAGSTFSDTQNTSICKPATRTEG